jgi:vitamin K-dependent gamma-carboxylase
MPTVTELALRARRGLERPVDPAGLALFRILFGLTMALATLRFVLYGWVDELYVAPPYHFTYLGFDWVKPFSHGGMLAWFAGMGLAALSLSLGFYTRVSAAVFGALFTYAELIDKATYLNHYYFASLVALLLVVLPSGAAWSVDAWLRTRRGGAATVAVPALAYVLLRVQVGVVYVFAGLAKLDADWLFRAEPLRTWLRARIESPLLTGLASEAWVPYAMSWAGAAFDLAVVPLLLFRTTRPFAFAVAVVFHVTIWLLFPIGVFSFVMLAAITLFFAPDWPRRFVGRVVRLAPFTPPATAKLRSWAVALAVAYALVQVLVPLRFAFYPGPVNWTEEGFRFAWRVMLVEKAGHVEFDVTSETPKARFHVFPRRELTPLQLRQMATQPDMIADYARHLRESYEARGHRNVRVFADAWVSLNGRRSQRFVDPTVDLAAAPRSFAAKPWILPLEPQRERSLAARR